MLVFESPSQFASRKIRIALALNSYRSYLVFSVDLAPLVLQASARVSQPPQAGQKKGSHGWKGEPRPKSCSALAHTHRAGRNAKVAVLDEDGMVRPSEKVEDGFLLANKTPGLFKKKLYALLVLCCSA